MTKKAHKELGPLGGIIANVVAVATESSDTRSWNLLPAAFSVSRMLVPAGEHNITVTHGGVVSKINYNLKAQELLILRDKGQYLTVGG